LLQIMASLCIIPLVSACGKKLPADSQTEGASATSSNWDLLRNALEAVRASPDHLAAQAERAIATRDAETIAALVRDRIRVLPAVAGYGDAATLWGAQATLRGGAGSLRDRAELLAQLLARAGFQITIVSVGRPAGLDEARLFQPRNLAFDPDMGKLAPLLAAAKLPTRLDTSPDRATADAAARLSDDLIALLPKDRLAVRPVERVLPDTIPVVEYTRDGRTGWAVACGDIAVLHEKPDGYRGAASSVESRPVVLSVSVALHPPPGSAADRSVLHEVLRTQWSTEELAGNQVVLGFMPPGDPLRYAGRDFSSEHIRIPTLRVVGKEADAPRLASGTPITLGGEIIAVQNSAAASGGAPALVVIAPEERTALAAKARQVTVRANASAFPGVDLNVSIAGADGAPIDGLSSPDLELTEDGVAQPFSLTRNTKPQGTRLLLLYDTSGSITKSWRTPAARTEFEARLANELVRAAQESPYLIQVIGLGATPGEGAWEMPDATRLRAAFAATSSTSDVWYSLGETLPASGASAAIFVSDCASSLEPPERISGYQRSIRAGQISLALLPIGEVDRAAVARIGALTSAIELDKDDAQVARKLGEFAARQAQQAATTNYRLHYRAEEQGASARRVELAVRGTAAVGNADYTVPPAPDRSVPPAIAGVFLTIELDAKTVRRRLGGVDVSYRGTVADTANTAAITEATQALNGLHTIHFEPAQPTTAAVLDDALSAVLTLESLWAARGKSAQEAIHAAGGIRRFDATAALLLDTVTEDAAEASAVPDGLRIVVTSDMPGEKGNVRKVDVVPEFNGWHGVSTDLATAFAAAMRRSLATSLREAKYLTDSAAARLQGQPCVAVPRFAQASDIAQWSAAQRSALAPMLAAYESMIRLVPASGEVPAMWIVDPSSGATVAVDADGRGGGECSLGDSPALQAALILLSAACTFSGPKAGTVPFYACVGADAYGAATAAAESFTNPAKKDGSDIFAAGTAAALGGLGLLAGAAFEGPENALARGLMAVLFAMLTTAATFCPPQLLASRDGTPQPNA